MTALSRNPTYLGEVTAVSSAAVSVHLASSVSSGLSIINGRTYRIGQVGSFVRIPQGYQDLFGIISEVNASAVPETSKQSEGATGRQITVQLFGESIAGIFERGIGQYPSIGDAVHIATEEDLQNIHNVSGQGHVAIGYMSSSESIPAKISINELVTRHSAVLGSTGSGKSTSVAGLLRSIASSSNGHSPYPNARILMLDIHGEYSTPLSDVAQVFSVEPKLGEERLYIPYWALDTKELLAFLVGNLNVNHEVAFTNQILERKNRVASAFPTVDANSMTVDTPLPFSLKALWYDLIDVEVATFRGPNRDQSTQINLGNPEQLIAPEYEPHGMGSSPPFINQSALGIQRELRLLRSRLLDRRYDFLLRPGPWEPDRDGMVEQDLDVLLKGWLGGDKPITILDLSSVPENVLEQLIGSILKIVYEALFWGRETIGGAIERPLLIAMEEAHRYLSGDKDNLALTMGQKIAKEGRKYGVGAMVISQRPSEINETILSQCGTLFTLRLTNPNDCARVQGILPEGLVGLLDVLPVLRTGEAVVMGEAAKLPMRCRIALPAEQHRPRSQDPAVSEKWGANRDEEDYASIVARWRAQRPSVIVNVAQGEE
ncbi:MAG: ATP-binding protein [Rhodospirillales bacterium]